MIVLKKYAFSIYLFSVVMVILLVAEFASLQINKSRGEAHRFFLSAAGGVDHRKSDRFLNIDPHLGYGRYEKEIEVVRFKKRHTWHQGFAVYSKEPIASLTRPIILTLGGSTTDPLNYSSSWPEELASILVNEQIPGTVINGGVGGYSTSQELLKLIRDGIELDPDLVITYNGVNDRDGYGPLPHPMVHKYQREVLRGLSEKRPSPFLPNTVSLFLSFGNQDKNKIRYTLGTETKKNRGEWYARNHLLMNAVAQAENIKYLGVLQPNAYVGNYEWADVFEREGRSEKYKAQIRSLYQQVENLPASVGYVHSFIDIFNGIVGVYTKDGIHNTEKGFLIIAEAMLDLIQKETNLLQPKIAIK